MTSVRRASIEDIPSIVKMLEAYSQTINIKCAATSFSVQKVSKLVHLSILQGYAWVTDNNGKTGGFLIAREQINVFTASLIETQLVGLYVYPEFRNGTSGGRLLKAYDKECENRGVKLSWIGTQVTTELTHNSLKRLGYILSEQSFKKER